MKDVAKAADVSVKTVSRVVNNERWVTPEVAKRVNVAIAALGYRVDSRARAFRNAELAGRTIAFIHAEMANPFFTAVHSGVEEVAAAAGCMIVTASSGDSIERQEALLQNFVDRRVDGLIVVPAGDTPLSAVDAAELRGEIARGMPVVFIDREHGEPADLVASDHFGGAVLATRHLIDHGHHNIAYLGDHPHLYSAALRLDGYTKAMNQCGLDPEHVFTGVATEEHAATVARKLLCGPRAPTAFFAAKNHLSAGVIQVLHKLKLHHQVALVGFDEVAMGNVIEPGITVIPQNAPELGRIAATLLLERMDGQRTEISQVVVPVALTQRGSGELPGPCIVGP